MAQAPTTPDSRLRVLLICRALPWHVPGGLEFHVLDLARGLADAGLDVHLLTAPIDSAPLGATALAELAASGITHHALAAGDPRRYSLAWLRRVGPMIDALHARHDYALIHGQEFALGFWRAPAQAPPVVLSVHGTITSETPLHADIYAELDRAARMRAWLRYGRRFLFARAWRTQLHAARAILVDSAFTRAELVQRWPTLAARIRTVPLGTREVAQATAPVAATHEEARAALGWADASPRLVTIGRLEWAKGHALAIDALARLKSLPWHYAIAGAGSAEGELRRQIAARGLGGRVELLGRVDDATRARLLAGADLFLWPERTHPAFGLVGSEALAAGTPVLAARRGAIPEVLAPQSAAWRVLSEAHTPGAPFGQQQPWLIEPADPAAWAARLRPLLEHPERLAMLRAGLMTHIAAESSAHGPAAYAAMIDATRAVYAQALGATR